MTAPMKTVLDDGTEVIRSCAYTPPGCHSVGCGLKLFVKDGKLIKVEGDPDHPVSQGRLCVRCLDAVEYINHPDRVIYPMKRDKKDRGLDKWERITWEEAYAIIKEETEKIWEKYGHESAVVFTGTGRYCTGFSHIISDVALGTPNFAYTQSGWSCFGPRAAVSSYLMGAWQLDLDYAATLVQRYDDPRFQVPEYIVVCGKEPLKSNPDGTYGYSLVDLMRRGAKIIHIDPSMTWLGSRADEVMRLRPGTDTALYMAMLHVIITEELYDHDFVEKFVYGWDEFCGRILGKDDGVEKTPEWAEEITWVPAEQIRRVSRKIANAYPVSWMWGLAFDQNVNGVQAAQCFVALCSICGSLDVPGGTSMGIRDWTYKSNAVGNYKSFLSEEMYVKRIGLMKYPFTEMTTDTCHPDELLIALETDEPYPIRMAVISNSNVIAPTNSSQPQRWHRALQKMEFVFATETFQTPMTMAFADVFLPLATFAEYDAVVKPQKGCMRQWVGAVSKVIEVGEAKHDFHIVMDLVKLLRPEALESLTDDLHEYLNDTLSGTPELGGFEGLQEKVVYLNDKADYRRYETGLARRDGQPGFETPTGKLELYSTVYEAFGEDPLPYFEEPRWSHISHPELKEEYPYILTTGARKYTSFHSENRQQMTLRKIDPYADFLIHPDEAKKLGIKNGDWCWIENMFGRCQEVAKLSYEVDPRIISASHGWWYPEENPEEPSLFGVWKSNINMLVPVGDIGKLGFGSPYKNLICKVYKVQD